MGATAAEDRNLQILAAAFDVDFYRAANPDLADAPDPIAHYVEFGWREGRDPAPWFSVRAYLAANADVVQADVEPLGHFLRTGRQQGREVAPSSNFEPYLYSDQNGGRSPAWRFRSFADAPAGADDIEQAATTGDPLQEERDLLKGEFDAAFYLRINTDVAEAGVDPLDHFLTCGWREHRNPNAAFSVRDYLDVNVDVARSGMNPFVHYVRTGRAEGRGGRTDLGFRHDILLRLKTVDVRVAGAREAQASVALQDEALLSRALAGLAPGLPRLHITFSHDDFTEHLGGVQLCLRREAAKIAGMGRDHLHVFPAKAWPVLRAAGEAGAMGVLLNGRLVGTFAGATIATALASAASGDAAGRSFAIHSLLGHNADETADIVLAAGVRAGFFWLHDFASLCAGFHLMRNDVEDCAAPPADSAACRICVYGDWRARHEEAHAALFRRLALTVVSPSQPTLDLWLDRTALAAAATLVHPHLTLAPAGNAAGSGQDGPLRVAFAGFPAPHKGWPLFRDLVTRLADDPRYEFHHLAAHPGGDLPLTFHPVSVSEAQPDAMRLALEAIGADVALIWPLCRETFSFSAHEAVAAGAAVITNPQSGNVAAFVAGGGHGLVLDGEEALYAAFERGEVCGLARGRRAAGLYEMVFSGMTADLLGGRA